MSSEQRAFVTGRVKRAYSVLSFSTFSLLIVPTCSLVLMVTGCSDTTSTADARGAADVLSDTSGDDAFSTDAAANEGLTAFRADVWADNWSAMYVGDTLVMEDSVSITTERSFNAESFSFESTRPFLVNVVMKDFIENDSGLEYIGTSRQQMGDGGYIAQIYEEATGEVVLVSSSDWRCLTLHTAPLDKSCEDSADPLTDCSWESVAEPEGWRNEDFDDSGWSRAHEYDAAAVDPKDGYLDISWDPNAAFIWGADLETHNTILCRVLVT